jgi:hypothetical protein
VVFRTALVMALSQMGSLNALEQTGGNAFWRRWAGAALPSADTIGRVFSKLDCGTIRAALRHLYTRLKRNKALKPVFHGLFALIVDGHESSASYLRCCSGCLRRTIHTSKGDRTQYYHRNVTAVLLCKDFPLLLDVESQRPGEDEIGAAMRLVDRVLGDYPRAFDLILGDSLYVRREVFELAQSRGKQVMAVLKDERRDLLQDALSLFQVEEPVIRQRGHAGRVTASTWDIEHFNSWRQFGTDVRVVRSVETSTVRRQMDGREEQCTSDWIWATTLSKHKVPTEAAIELGHGRWVIENNELNELVTYWHADHLYRHHPTAIEAFWLLTMLAYNLFHAFIHLNLKGQLRYRYTKLHWARLIAADLYCRERYCLPPVPI